MIDPTAALIAACAGLLVALGAWYVAKIIDYRAPR